MASQVYSNICGHGCDCNSGTCKRDASY